MINKKFLSKYGRACKDIELTEAAIGILERVSGMHNIVKDIKKKQQYQLEDINKYAALIEIPFI